MEYDPSRTIVDLFLEQAQFRPLKAAVVQDVRSTSYQELSRLASGMASSLAAEGIGRGDRVAIVSPRSIDNVAAQLAVLATGAAFTPLDTRNPVAHLLSVARELAPAMVLSADPGLAAELAESGFRVRGIGELGSSPPVPLEVLAADPARRAGACDPACIIFTSGTTGRPKGVVLPHRGICRLVCGQDYADLGPDQVILNIASPGFDVCLSQIYSAILNGGTLAVVPGCVPSLDAIAGVIGSTGTTLADLTVGLFNLMVEHRLDGMAPLKQVICGGDVMSEAHARRFQAAYPGIRLINAYGPAENSVTSLCHTLESGGWASEGVPIGTPIARDRAFVLDEDGRAGPPRPRRPRAGGGARPPPAARGRLDVDRDRRHPARPVRPDVRRRTGRADPPRPLDRAQRSIPGCSGGRGRVRHGTGRDERGPRLSGRGRR
jgi:non-ribosomal peptide synthetase component F